ncbi:hypothetical protein [Nonlabens ponticola]|uniref:Uncharacterized protein n=1 Tax=Nonlabens ponticola TaxID=2496866 RepID=A0A3S9N003_9FLAO|nr:hypothetical protein [Nonlabens ponticola]AZQ44865.1 hypothetical protein EJ995_11730 [Nonlabens ponticola]
MTLKSIEIRNVKGIEHKKFDLDIVANKPSLLVAPNGFGKSSFTCGFSSMNNARIVLKDEDRFRGDNNNHPIINIVYEKEAGNILSLSATHESNTIKDEFDYFTIKSTLKAKGSASFYGGGATARMIIETVVLIDTIPPNRNFNNYTVTELRQRFGGCGRVLPNPNVVFANRLLVERLSENYTTLSRGFGQQVTNRIQLIIDEVNEQNGTAAQLKNWINANCIERLREINHLSTLAEIIGNFDIGQDSEVDNFLLAIQVIWIYNRDVDAFKAACKYSNYRMAKDEFDMNLSHFDSTWKNIRTTQEQGRLLLKFPRANEISNGQRDILSFIAMLFKAKIKLRKNASILIIDEVFDYLDDANLVAAQYYVTNFIKEYKDKGRKIYPLILTHLNPLYFKNYTFSNQKTYYLDKSSMQVIDSMRRLIVNRNDVNIADVVSSRLLHYHPEAPDKREEFRNLNIRELWGVGTTFRDFTFEQVQNYIENNAYDPFAVCCGVRVKVEMLTYAKIDDDNNRTEFLTTKKTRPKLDFAKSIGIISPEPYYLLAVIYNEGMHWKNNVDNVSPIASKLENLTIKKIISDLFQA